MNAEQAPSVTYFTARTCALMLCALLSIYKSLLDDCVKCVDLVAYFTINETLDSCSNISVPPKGSPSNRPDLTSIGGR
eukprot:5210838-Amphidinium_carterae.1